MNPRCGRRNTDVGSIMGQAHPTGSTRRRRFSSLCRPFTPHSRNLSATFHVLDTELRWELLNINTATEEELMTLPGVTRCIARNIVDYRQAIGGFKKVEDLALVSGVGASRLQVFRSEITVRRGPPSSRSPRVGVPQRSPLRDMELYRLVAPLSQRPLAARIETGPVGSFWVALWNLAGLTCDKASNLGVLEVVCRTALENGTAIIACQEICSRDALDLVVQELNDPQLSAVASWEPHDRQWDQATPLPASGPVGLFSGFLFSGRQGIRLSECYAVDLDSSNGLTGPCPCVARFKAPGLEFVVVSILLRSLKAHDISLLFPSFVAVISQRLRGEDNILLMGDLPPTENAVRMLSDMGFHLLWPSKLKPHDTTQIWCSSKLRKFCTGSIRRVQEGLSHPLIPCGWHWGGSVSDLPPLLVQLLTDIPNGQASV
ncbi:endonuclease/exonuclease/phosphatase family domain-containing protein 1-like isoform X3 [Dermacentor andersoni]|uniref:endonuclease/exonuclease/phosphatase family domain-containing protein 1-like isoform X3 n=1 Tax=Dermacentor andersoni TaxID=34620 RepID=UPI00215518C4|nr:endonuclease/exonuclease/phosphatase family domain-containing protein 1-like isoform X3 [Dermacentor andersoni]